MVTEEKTKETRGFQTEVKQLLHLMINALYSNKEIFLRELISNASDAADKLRFEAIEHPNYFEATDTELDIQIDYDKAAKTITIKDNGIGMSREEVISHLGTIAKSGTKEFFGSLTGDQAKDSHLIGQFGVGFYSSFIVAWKVSVKTRRAGTSAQEATLWESTGDGEYTLETIEKMERGTEVTLHIKAGEEEFLDGMRLRHIVTKYSDHIGFPIKMKQETPPEESAKEDGKAEIEIAYEAVNKATALWALPKSNIEDEEYQEFYKHVAHDFENPLAWAHNKVEGRLEYTTLLYIPARAPFDLYQPNKSRGLKLYVKRVFIMDDAEQFLPNYLRFVRGVIDSSDLPLNISREVLQSNRVVDSMRSAVIKRVLSVLENLSTTDSDKYLDFWREFGMVLKEGPAEDFANKELIASLLRFSSTHTNEEKQIHSLEQYIERMKPNQEKIYYMAADTFNAARHSPHLELFREKGVEVVLLYDRIDEWMMSHLSEYKGKTFQSVAQGALEDLDFSEEDKTQTEQKKKDKEKQVEVFQATLDKIKDALSDKVKDVRLTERLTSSPSCIVADEDQMTSQMERLLKSAGQDVNTKPVLELNPNHLLVQRLQTEDNTEHFSDLSQILLDQAVLSEGGQLEDPATFVKKFNELLLNVAK